MRKHTKWHRYNKYTNKVLSYTWPLAQECKQMWQSWAAHNDSQSPSMTVCCLVYKGRMTVFWRSGFQKREKLSWTQGSELRNKNKQKTTTTQNWTMLNTFAWTTKFTANNLSDYQQHLTLTHFFSTHWHWMTRHLPLHSTDCLLCGVQRTMGRCRRLNTGISSETQ